MTTFAESVFDFSVSEGTEGTQRDEAKSKALISYLTEYIPEREAVRPKEEVGLPAPGSNCTTLFAMELTALLDKGFDRTAPGAVEQAERLYLERYVKKAEKWPRKGELPAVASESTPAAANTAL